MLYIDKTISTLEINKEGISLDCELSSLLYEVRLVPDNVYLRPDGTSYILRPDGTSFYVRP